MSQSRRFVVVRRALFAGFVCLPLTLSALDRTWIGGNVDWIDNGSTANWSPADEPDTDDTAIFNTANSVNLGSDNAILALTLSGGIDLFTGKFSLAVDGLVQLSGAGTNLFIEDSGNVNADNLTINSGGTVELTGGLLTLNEESGTSLLDLNTGGTLSGHGTVAFSDTPVLATTLLSNDGTLTALSRGLTILSPPPAGTLVIRNSGVVGIGSRVDLDGTGTAGVVNVNRNQTLDINFPLSDNFAGTLNLFQTATFDLSNAWTLDGGTITVDNGFIDNLFPIPDIPAGVSTIAGGALTQSGGTVQVVDADGTLQFSAPFTLNGGNLVNNGLVIFNANATLAAAANFIMPTTSSSLTVAAGRTVTINQTNFDLDGANALTNVLSVNQGGLLAVSISDYDPDTLINRYDGTLNLVGGLLNMSVADASFVMDGVLNFDSSVGSAAGWTNEPLTVGNDAGALDADLNVLGGSFNDVTSNVVFNSDADVDIAAGARLRLINVATATFNAVNGANNAEFTGAGTLEFNNAANFNEAVTFNMTGGRVDFTGLDTTGATVNVDAPVVINVALFGSYGQSNTMGGPDTLDINHSVGIGVLTVNLDSPTAEWTLNSPAVMTLVNGNTPATLLAGSDVNINGTVNVTGDVRSTARMDIAGTVNVGTVGEPLRLAGGNGTDDPNTMFGGTVNGPGLLGADTDKLLQGFGVINANIDFDGTASLFADDGTLTINGTLVDVGTIGTADADGTLNVSNPWNSNASTGVQLRGGALGGGTITNDVPAGIGGHGLVTARVINNTQLFASIADSLVIQTAGNDNDWDGTSNTGQIKAVLGNIELRDNAPFGFTGTVEATSGHTAFTNGFALDFNPGSTLSLSSGGTYESTRSTDLGGTVTVGAGAESTVKVAVNSFLTFKPTSTTTLNGNLRLENNNARLNAGATFSGAGAIRVPVGSHLIPDGGSNINALLVNEGTIRVAGFDTVGNASVKDYQQLSTGKLFIEITGTLLNQYDRLTASGQAIVGGVLNLDIDGGFVPVDGDTFIILSASNGVFGKFFGIESSGLPTGFVFEVTYTPNAVVVTVHAGNHYDQWIKQFPSLTNPADRLRSADPDHDGLTNIGEFAFNEDPTKSRGASRVVVKVAPVGGELALTITLPVRYETIEFPPAPGGELTLFYIDDAMNYHIQGSNTLANYPLDMAEVTGADAAAIQAGLPPVDPGWTLRTFRSPGPVPDSAHESLRVVITE